VVAELEHLALREVLHGDYRIIYRYAAARVTILGVFHGARRLDERSLSEV